MREIKFRAWDEGNEVMINAFSITELYLGSPKRLLLETDNLMQYTGFKDKNGAEIYEGDIVKYYDSTTMWLKSEVINVGSAFAIQTYENPILLYDFQHDYEYQDEPIPELEVIGNIYENPELVK